MTGVATRAIVWVATAQIVLGLFGYVLELQAPDSAPPTDVAFHALVLSFTGAAVILISGGKRDARAGLLAVAFLLAASAFANHALVPLASAGGPGAVLALVGTLRVEVLLTYFSWSFISRFPLESVGVTEARFAARATRASLVWGVLLLVTNFFVSVARLVRPGFEPRGLLAALTDGGILYWPPLLLLMGAGFLLVWYKARRAAPSDRRRVDWMMAAVTLGVAPMLLVNAVGYTVPAAYRYLTDPRGLLVVGSMVYPLMFAAPIVAAYAVLVHRALDVRLALRSAMRYALARSGLGLVLAIPLIAVLAVIGLNLDQPLANLLEGPNLAVLAGSIAASVAVFGLGAPVSRRIDRVFFRDQYDARRILSSLVDECRRTADLQDLTRLVRSKVDQALHPSFIELMVVDEASGALVPVDGEAPALALNSTLARGLERSSGVLTVDWDRSIPEIERLPRADVEWLADLGAELIVPIRDRGERPRGLMALGEKRSELPFTREDHELLISIVSSMSLTLDVSGAWEPGTGWAESEPAYTARCEACGTLTDRGGACTACGAATVPCAVPRVVGGKYEIIQQVGEGGMGVVYRAYDRTLGRTVAIKSLPRLSPRHSARLRREARTIASISHPNLEAIHALESWRGTPMLVLEYLPGGTLKDVLAKGPLDLNRTGELLAALADVVATLHGRGIVHRDIKPANVGFGERGEPKLMDFGVARMMDAARVRGVRSGSPSLSVGRARRRWETVDPHDTLTVEGAVVGTLLYMSPEALRGLPADASRDLWSLAVLLFESIAGVHPAAADDVEEAFEKILGGELAELAQVVPETPPALCAFFADALSPDPARRPRSASELRHRFVAATAAAPTVS